MLAPRQQERLRHRWRQGLLRAQRLAAQWHRAQKQQRLADAQCAAREVLVRVDGSHPAILELALALLYLGEGTKRNAETALGNSDPDVLRFFLGALERVYHLDRSTFRYELTLRADHRPEYIKRYWAKELRVPMQCFRYVGVDQRTSGSPSYAGYHGVCQIRCGHVAIQRRLLAISALFIARYGK
ncbi:hypothetical protein HYV74_03890 [Candidatus Uhrbacteria bacterium]|nr:hypothetical protein [Candidatus Uhrbacteria bacterium]